MMSLKTMRAGGVALAALLAASPVLAQPYRCHIQGQWSYTDKPCPRAEVGAYGPQTPVRSAAQPSLTMPARAPKYLSLMSARCATQNDALRTAASRGLSAYTRSELQRVYEQECRDNERAAMQRLYDQDTQQRQHAQAEMQQRQAEQQRAQRHCAQLRDLISSRSARAETAGDSGLARSRALYAEQCEKRTAAYGG